MGQDGGVRGLAAIPDAYVNGLGIEFSPVMVQEEADVVQRPPLESGTEVSTDADELYIAFTCVEVDVRGAHATVGSSDELATEGIAR